MPEPEKLERVPPVALTSAELKFVEATERVKLRVAVSAALRVLTLLEMAIVGGTGVSVSNSRLVALKIVAPVSKVMPESL